MLGYPRNDGIRGSYGERSNMSFVKKVPQTSVAPTYKLTLPSDFVTANAQHLIGQEFDLVDEEGKKYEVSILPRKNKDKYEFTLQGWKQFAVAHQIQPSDRFQFEFTADPLRVSGKVIRKNVLRQKIYTTLHGSHLRTSMSLPSLPLAGLHGLSSLENAALHQDECSPASARTGPASLHNSMEMLGYAERMGSGSMPFYSGLQGAMGVQSPTAHLGSRGSFSQTFLHSHHSGNVSSIGGFQSVTPSIKAHPCDPSHQGQAATGRGVDSGDGVASVQTHVDPDGGIGSGAEHASKQGGEGSGPGAGSAETGSDGNAWLPPPSRWTPIMAGGASLSRKRSRRSDDSPPDLSPGLKRAKESSNAKELLDGVVLQGNGGDNLHLLVSAATQQLSNTQDIADEDTPRANHEDPTSHNEFDVPAFLRMNAKELEQQISRGWRSVVQMWHLHNQLHDEEVPSRYYNSLREKLEAIRIQMRNECDVLQDVFNQIRNFPDRFRKLLPYT